MSLKTSMFRANAYITFEFCTSQFIVFAIEILIKLQLPVPTIFSEHRHQ